MPPPCLLIAPQGLTVTGVTTWIALVAKGLADHDSGLNRPVGVLVHGSIEGHAEFDLDLPDGAKLFRRDDLPDLDQLNGDLSPIIKAYRNAARELSHDPRCDAAVVLVPSRHAECFAACAALTIVDPEAFRVLGLQHIDGAYETAFIDRYEPALAALAGVSSRIKDSLRTRFPSRADETFWIPNAAHAPREVPVREPLADRPVRLLYTGRIEHEQKRVRALVRMSDELTRAGVWHELTFLGDGPASGEIDNLAADRPSITHRSMVPPDQVAGHLAGADVLVLASRTEGMSKSLLEAMAQGCCPVITDTPSGARDVIEDGVHGVLVPFEPTDDDDTIGAAMAKSVARAMSLDLATLGANAHERVRSFFSPDRLARVVAEVIDRTAATPPRSWPADRPVAYNASGEAGGPVPPGGRARFAAALQRLAGKRVAIHGTGQHTRQLAPLLAQAPCLIVGFTDDDPGAAGSRLFNWPVVAPKDAPTLGAEAVLISSAMHESAIFARRGVYEDLGIEVRRVYETGE
ncbi:MAG: glycosyltransferase [Planctomycetota bacterium]